MDGTEQTKTEDDMKAVEIRTNKNGQTDCLVNTFWLSLSTDRALGLEPDSRYAVMAVKLPDGYRLATDEDRNGEKPKNTMRVSASQKFVHSPNPFGWEERYPVYAVPITPPLPFVELKIGGKTVELSQESVAAIREAVAK